MTTDVKIRNEKVQYYIDRKAAKISTFLSGKIYKYEQPRGEEILLSNKKKKYQSKLILDILHKEKFFKNKEKRLKSMEKKQINAITNQNERSVNGEMKLEGAKKLQNVFKSNLNEISRRDINQKSKKVH